MLKRGVGHSVASSTRLAPQAQSGAARLRSASPAQVILQRRTFSAAPPGSPPQKAPPSHTVPVFGPGAPARTLRVSGQRPSYTYRETATPAARWHSALRQRQFGVAIEQLRKEDPGNASAWTKIVTAVGRAGQGSHIATIYNATDSSVKQDPIFWVSVLSACRQPSVHMSPLAAQVVEDLMREYRHAWYDMMPQMLVNAFLALVASDGSPQLATLSKLKDWARSRSLLYQSEPYSALVYCYARRKKLTELVSVLEEATSDGVAIHTKNMSDAINALVLGNRPTEALTWTKHAAGHAIPIDGPVLNALQRQLCALGRFKQAAELEGLFEAFNHKPDVVAYTKLMLAISSWNTIVALPRVIDVFENKLKPMADEEAYRVLIKTMGRAQRGDLVIKYWQEAVKSPVGQTLSKKFFEQLVEAALASQDLTTISAVLDNIPLEDLTSGIIAEVALFLAHCHARNDKFVQKMEELARSGRATKAVINALLGCYAIEGRKSDVLACYQYFSKDVPMDETSFCFFFDSVSTAAELDEQINRLSTEAQRLGARLLLTDRIRGAVLRALLRTGVKMQDAREKAQQLAEQIQLPPPGPYSSEAVLLRKLAMLGSVSELRAVEVEVRQHESIFKGQASSKAIDSAMLAAATKFDERQLAEEYSQRRERYGGSKFATHNQRRQSVE